MILTVGPLCSGLVIPMNPFQKQRELLKQLKHNGTEPSSGVRVIEELFKRGDIVSADTLKAPSTITQSSYSLSVLKSTLGNYIWGSTKPNVPSLDDPIVPVAALKIVAERASTLSGPIASADIHTVKSFADTLTASNTRDAEAVIAYIVSKGEATAVFTDPTKEDPDPVLGVRIGKKSENPSDKAVLRTKAALERMEKVSSHLEGAIEVERKAAVAAAKSGNKSDALARLKKKNALEAKLTGTRATATKLSGVLMGVDEAESQRDAISALETGMSSLRMVTEGGITADRVDAVAADYDEIMVGQQDVRHALGQLNQDSSGVDLDSLEQELHDLMVADTKSSGTGVEQPAHTVLENQLEELMAGETKAPASAMKTPALSEEEEQLLKIMEGLGISSEDAAKMQDPEKVAQADAAKAREGQSELSASASDGQAAPTHGV